MGFSLQLSKKTLSFAARLIKVRHILKNNKIKEVNDTDKGECVCAKQDMQRYLDYWDDVVRRWFDEDIEGNQNLFVKDSPLGLNPKHLLEHYWGNPKNCSIVIANYINIK